MTEIQNIKLVWVIDLWHIASSQKRAASGQNSEPLMIRYDEDDKL